MPSDVLRPRGRPLHPSRLPDDPVVRRARARLDAEDPDEPWRRSSHRHRVAIEWMAVLAGALLVALVVKVGLLQAFVIPSESMTPTLEVGDRVLVNKASYRLNDLGRGDLVVFERPDIGGGDDADLIKRLVGLPGETIRASGGVVYVDDRPLEEDYLGPTAHTEDFAPVTVGAREVFVMGDNRQSSRDSRFFGPVPIDSIIGRAFLRVWPLGGITRL